MIRAFATHERDPAVRNPDFLAERLAGESLTFRLVRWLASVPVLHACCRWGFGRMAPGAYWGETARVKHFDAILHKAMSDGISQVVILGAGLDSRPYRCSDGHDGVKFFELDHPATATYKRERVEAIFGSLPTNVTYVSHDLTASDLGDALDGTGFNPNAPTLVLWIGVSMYLGPEIMHSVLQWSGGLAARSSLAFDYIERRFFEDTRMLGAPQRTRLMLALAGERLTYGINSTAVPALLEEHGLTVQSHIGPEEAEARYLRRSSGRTAGRPFPYFRYVQAAVA